MKKNTVIKILISTILIFCMFSLITPITYAGSLGDIVGGADNFTAAGKEDVFPEENMQNMSDLLYNVLLVIGIIVAVITGMGIGIKFMTSGIEEKAKVKETLIPYIAGCVVIFGAFTIWKIVVTILQNASNI